MQYRIIGAGSTGEGEEIIASNKTAILAGIKKVSGIKNTIVAVYPMNRSDSDPFGVEVDADDDDDIILATLYAESGHSIFAE